MTNRESNQEAEPVGWADRADIYNLQAQGHCLLFADNQGDFSVPLFASPQQETEGREITEEIEAAKLALLALHRKVLEKKRDHIFVVQGGEFNDILETLLNGAIAIERTAALRAERPVPAAGG